MYGIAGERRLTELELDWLDGYEGSRPVRIGNAASDQRQLDVYGEVLDALYHARLSRARAVAGGVGAHDASCSSGSRTGWREPDEGIWEVRGPRRHFTHSKVMAWVAFDRAVRSVEEDGLDGPVDRWRALRREIHDEVCREGFDQELGAFTQSYGSPRLDASVLMMPLVGFLPADDPRVVGTVAAIERAPRARRASSSAIAPTTRTSTSTPSRPVKGRSFPARSGSCRCSCCRAGWTRPRSSSSGFSASATTSACSPRSTTSDAGRLLGNFPQAFTHLTLVDAALTLDEGWCRRAGRPGADETRPGATEVPR